MFAVPTLLVIISLFRYFLSMPTPHQLHLINYNTRVYCLQFFAAASLVNLSINKVKASSYLHGHATTTTASTSSQTLRSFSRQPHLRKTSICGGGLQTYYLNDGGRKHLSSRNLTHRIRAHLSPLPKASDQTSPQDHQL